MIVVKFLEMAGGQYLRYVSTNGAVMPRPDNFGEFAVTLEKHGLLVTPAPELDGKVVNQAGGQTVSIFATAASTVVKIVPAGDS